MPMPDELQHRFEMLQGRFIDAEYLVAYYGIDDYAGNADLQDDISRYRKTLRACPDLPDDMIDRYVLEGFLQTRRLLPKKWAAARLGMTTDMLTTVLDRRLNLPTPLRKEYVEYNCLVEDGLSEDLIRAIPELRFRTFYDQESFCERLHAALSQTLNIPEADIQAGKLWCATDQQLNQAGLGDYPRRFGYHFDCLTCDPLSVAHAVWLDFKKPLSLGPDRCSKLIFVQYRGDLEGWVAGTRIPDDLHRYEECLAGEQ